jgi:hypothetical protein
MYIICAGGFQVVPVGRPWPLKMQVPCFPVSKESTTFAAEIQIT